MYTAVVNSRLMLGCSLPSNFSVATRILLASGNPSVLIDIAVFRIQDTQLVLKIREQNSQCENWACRCFCLSCHLQVPSKTTRLISTICGNVYIAILLFRQFLLMSIRTAHPSGRAFQGVGLRPLNCWGCGFESRWVHGYLCLVIVVCCQVKVSATGRSLVQRSPTEYEYDRRTSWKRPRPTKAVEAWRKRSMLRNVPICEVGCFRANSHKITTFRRIPWKH